MVALVATAAFVFGLGALGGVFEDLVLARFEVGAFGGKDSARDHKTAASHGTDFCRLPLYSSAA